jgi:hypothetical protein
VANRKTAFHRHALLKVVSHIRELNEVYWNVNSGIRSTDRQGSQLIDIQHSDKVLGEWGGGKRRR